MADEVGLKVKLDGKEVEQGAKKAGDAIDIISRYKVGIV